MRRQPWGWWTSCTTRQPSSCPPTGAGPDTFGRCGEGTGGRTGGHARLPRRPFRRLLGAWDAHPGLHAGAGVPARHDCAGDVEDARRAGAAPARRVPVCLGCRHGAARHACGEVQRHPVPNRCVQGGGVWRPSRALPLQVRQDCEGTGPGRLAGRQQSHASTHGWLFQLLLPHYGGCTHLWLCMTRRRLSDTIKISQSIKAAISQKSPLPFELKVLEALLAGGCGG